VQGLRAELAGWHAAAGGQVCGYTQQLSELQEELQAQLAGLREGVDQMRGRVRAALAAAGEAPAAPAPPAGGGGGGA
jgi:outer membrane murein-binding lipoprotein Lpp